MGHKLARENRTASLWNRNSHSGHVSYARTDAVCAHATCHVVAQAVRAMHYLCNVWRDARDARLRDHD